MTAERPPKLFPTLQIRAGSLIYHGRWEHSAALLAGTIADLAPRLSKHGFSGVHALLLDGLTEANRRAVESLAGAVETVIVEGGLRDAAGCAAAIAHGARMVIVEPETIDDPQMARWIDEGGPAPLMAVGDFRDRAVRALAGRAVSDRWLGLVLDARPSKLTEEIQAWVEECDGEMVLRVDPTLHAGEQIDLLDQILDFNSPMLIDVEYLIEMTRTIFEFGYMEYPPRN